MIFVISPAKTLDMSPNNLVDHTVPDLLKQSKALVSVLKKYKVKDLEDLMGVSEKIATLNVERFREFKAPFTLDNAKQAMLAFQGDVYKGLGAADFSATELAYAQTHLRILSGLYGLLRPLDLMQAYRLEMGTRLETKKGENLYKFWGNQITQALNKTKATALINLASNE